MGSLRRFSSRKAAQAAASVLPRLAWPMLVIDRSGIIQYANPAATKLLRYPLEELWGRPFATLQVPELSRLSWRDFLLALEQESYCRGHDWLRDRGGKAFLVDLRFFPIYGNRKSVVGAMGMVERLAPLPRELPAVREGHLTHRERDVLRLVASGATAKETGKALGISPRTVEVHRARIMRKLGVRRLVDLVRLTLTRETDLWKMPPPPPKGSLR